MQQADGKVPSFALSPRIVGAVVVAALVVAVCWSLSSRGGSSAPGVPKVPSALRYQPRAEFDLSGFQGIISDIDPWPQDASLQELAAIWKDIGYRRIEGLERQLADKPLTALSQLGLRLQQVALFNYEGGPRKAYELLSQMRAEVERDDDLAQTTLFSLIFYQGVTALRLGETENCVMCIGQSACILPIAESAVHTKPQGSRLAIQHFTEYLQQFPDDELARWLLNLAHMTLGEHPAKVDPAFLVKIDHFTNSEFDLGVFRDVGHLVGVNRLNMSGGGIMEDFNNDGLLDIAISCFDRAVPMAMYLNNGQGAFDDVSEASGVTGQIGGKNCVQTDYNNDGNLDIFVMRGAWLPYPMRPSLLRNDGHGTFTDVTAEAGLLASANSGAAAWADYDNDGWLDVYLCCETSPNRLYRNLGNGSFEEVAQAAGLDPKSRTLCKGATWLDYDNDGYPDLFVDHLAGDGSRLFHNEQGSGEQGRRFREVTREMGIRDPQMGFACWAWDYDNDGWQDIFAASFSYTMPEMVRGLQGQGRPRQSSCLYRNLEGKGFEERAAAVGLDQAYSTMGSNFGDFDNDGFLDLYLGTGDPNLSTLIPNRMFKNVAGSRFAEVTGSSRTGHLQKGHGVACGDWDRDGDNDIFIEMGGAIPGDRYHNILFQNPGQGNNWLTIKLVGEKTNKAAIGARIKVVTAAQEPQTIHRHISSGGSWGANPLQQTIGLGTADRVALLEIHWPTSGTVQTFHDVDVNQAIEITEFADTIRPLDWKPLPQPQ